MTDIVILSVIEDDADALIGNLKTHGLDVTPPPRRVRGIVEIIVALSSAGALSLVYRGVVAFLDRNKSHEVSVECGGRKITIKGHSTPEELEFLRLLAPTQDGDA